MKRSTSMFALLAVIILFGLHVSAAQAATINVPADAPTIAAAVATSSPGDIIVVAAGTYIEHVNINKSLTLQGANVGTTGTSSGRVSETIVTGSSTDAPFAINANNVTIDGFKIQAGANNLNSGVWIATGSTGWKIQNNILTDNAIAVFAQCGSNCLLQHNLFDANNNPGPAGGAGVYTEVTNGLTIDQNEFRNHSLNNPIIFAAVATTSHQNLVVSNNYIHDNFSGIYALAISGGVFSGNNISATGATDLSFSGANTNIQVTQNILHDSARGVRIEDPGFGFGGNSAITINRNALTNDSNFGVGNLGGYSGNVDASCNWWGAANGPGPVGPGSGSPVTTNVTFSSWLTTSDLANDPCSGTPPPDVTVTIIKYVDGVHANITNAENQSFPMQSSWNATNIGAGSGSFSLAPTTYEAQTSNMTSGASYSTNEVTSGNSVGASCTEGKPFALVGYSTGNSQAAAATSTVATTSPSLSNITTNKYVIVWNKDCTPKLTVTKLVINDNGGTATTSDFVLFIDTATTTSGTATTSTVGAHLVSEGSHPGYTATISGDCDANGNVTLAAGDNKSCTITNNDNAPDVKVTIVKYIGATHATAGNASSTSFPMVSSWNAVNLGGPGSGTYALSTIGFNTPSAYEAVTSNMTSGSSYTTNENTGTPVVGPNCANNQQFRLVGYTTGNTLLAAQGGTPTTTIPAFTNITSNKWVLVWNEPCSTTPLPPPANACSNPTQAPAGFTLRNGTGGNDIVTLSPGTMFVGKGGNDVVNAGAGNYIVCTGGGNDIITLGAGDSTVDAGGGNNSVTTGNGSGYITTGGGNDIIKTGNGTHTIDAGGGNNSVTTGDGTQTVMTGGGNDSITTGSGSDTINAGGGNNSVKSNAGNDSISAGGGNDSINGGADTDTCNAGGGINSVSNCEL